MNFKQLQVGTCTELGGSLQRAAEVDYAYQPIVSATTLQTHGFEALARFPGGEDGKDVNALFEEAASSGTIREVEITLLGEAVSKFAHFGGATSTILFCNVDNRLYGECSNASDEILKVIDRSALPASNVCVEISERMPIESVNALERLVENLGQANMRIALDDFGIGLSGLQRLLMIEPHYVKIDRCFIDGLASNRRKQAIVSKLCGLAHALGFITVAEGIEGEQDFRAARELGCDLAQGFLIARPISRVGDLRLSYDSVNTSVNRHRVSSRVAELVSNLEPIEIDAPLANAANRFKNTEGLRLLPVVDSEGLVKGALYEEDIRRLLMSEFGGALLANRGVNTQVRSLMRRCPLGEAQGSVEAIVNSYVASEEALGMVLVLDGRYAGYLSNNAVLRLAAERDVSEARDQNPLTHLPGNQSIQRQIEIALSTKGAATLALLDFDHFKAFNDCYGFAAGDRSIQMLAKLLTELRRKCGAFVGHIGGDDFFVLMQGQDSECLIQLQELCTKFASDVRVFYNDRDLEAGGIHSIDRFGEQRFFPMMRVSAGIIHLPNNRSHLSTSLVERELGVLKNSAKASDSGVVASYLPECAPALMTSELGRVFKASRETGSRRVECDA